MKTKTLSSIESVLPNIARLIFDKYPHSDLLPIDPEFDCPDLATLRKRAKVCGDPLFLFLVNEIMEGTEGVEEKDLFNRVHDILRRAANDIEKVREGILFALATKGG
jgi:hypothetical protein